MAGRGQASGGKPSCRKAAKSPEARSLSHKSRDGASERRFFYYQGASFGAPSPLIVEGRELKAQLARRRGNAAAWLFEIRIRKIRKPSTHTPPWSSRTPGRR